VCVKSEELEMVEYLVGEKADINAQDRNKETAMHKCLETKNIQILEELAKHKPCLTIPNSEGKTVTDLANQTQLAILHKY
jgi:ankyrin repeat protein